MTRKGFSTCSCGSQHYTAAKRDGISVRECSSCHKPWGACQHSGFLFALLDETRYCQCDSCGHQWNVHLGRRVQMRDHDDTDSIPNAMTGLEHLESSRRKAVRI